MGNRASRGDKDRGAALVEMALVLPLLDAAGRGDLGDSPGMERAQRHGSRGQRIRPTWRNHRTLVGRDTTDLCGSSPSSQQELRCVADEQLAAAAIDPVAVLTTCIELGVDPCGVGNTTGNDKVAVSLIYPDYVIDFVFFSVSVDLKATAVSRFES